MPILIDSAPLFYPKENYKINKYFDIVKYISLLKNQALFFCRVDKLEDQKEGTTPLSNFYSRVIWYQHMRDTDFWEIPMPDDKIIDIVEKQFEREKHFRDFFCVNCWNKEDVESVALWKIYSDNGKGIMIKSTVNSLNSSLINSLEKIYLSEVKYLNYEIESILDGDVYFPIIHKQTAYSYENEVRLIHEVATEGVSYDWSKHETQNGVFIKVDLNELIDEIIIGPHAPSYFLKLIEDITEKYGIKKPISNSKL